jgi:hypothetical protein
MARDRSALRAAQGMLSQARSLPFVPVWETECAFKWLDVAYQERDLGVPSLKTDFLLDSLRTDLRLTELVKRVGRLRIYRSCCSTITETILRTDLVVVIALSVKAVERGLHLACRSIHARSSSQPSHGSQANC